MTTPSRVLLLGDAHGDYDFVVEAIEAALDEECDAIFQLGDFGYYEHIEAGHEFLGATSAYLESVDIDLFWIDGNHDGMVPVWRNYGLTPHGDEIHSYVQGCSRGDFIQTRYQRIFYVPRGHRWQWNGTTFMGLGGAYSINRRSMIEGIDWWVEEELSDDQVDFICQDTSRVDVLLSHDIPEGFKTPALAFWPVLPEAQENRLKVLDVVEAVKPQLIVHGHYHSRYGNWWRTPSGHHVRVEGLGSNRNGSTNEPWMVLSLGL